MSLFIISKYSQIKRLEFRMASKMLETVVYLVVLEYCRHTQYIFKDQNNTTPIIRS